MMAQQQQTPFTLVIDPDTKEFVSKEELSKRSAWAEEVRRSNLLLSYTDPITNTKITQDEWIRREQVRVKYDLNPRHCINQEAVAELGASLSRQEWLKASPKRRSTAATLDPAVGVAVELPSSVGFRSDASAMRSLGKGAWNLGNSPFVPERVSEETSPFYSCVAFIFHHREALTSELFKAYQQLAEYAKRLSQSTGNTVTSSVLSGLVAQVLVEFGVASIRSIDVQEEVEMSKEAFVSVLVDRYGWNRETGEFVNIDINSLSEDLIQALTRAREIFGDGFDDTNKSLSYDDDYGTCYPNNGKQPESLNLFDNSIDSPSLISAVLDADMERAIIASLKDMAVQDGLGVSSSSTTSSTSTHGRRSDTILSNASSYDMADEEDIDDDYAIFGIGSVSSVSDSGGEGNEEEH